MRAAAVPSVSDLLDLYPDPHGGRRARRRARVAGSDGGELEPLAQAPACAGRYVACHLSIPHPALPVEALPLRRDLDEHPVAGDSRHDLEAGDGFLNRESVLGHRARRSLDDPALHRGPGLTAGDIGAPSLQRLDALLDLAAARRARILG